MLHSADRTLAAAAAETITALALAPEDAAAVRLTQRYAAEIDDAADPAAALERLGPKLLAALEALGATPQARSRIKGGRAADAVPGKLQALRAAHRA
jgi:hypothetical protein